MASELEPDSEGIMATLITHVTIQLDAELNQYIEAEAKKECRSKRKQLLFMLISEMNASLQKKEKDNKSCN